MRVPHDLRDAIINTVRKVGAELIVLDNFSTLATIEDENAASSFNAPIAFLLKLKQAGSACLLVHHSGKSGNSYRGSSKIATTFEVIMGLESSKDPLKNLNTDKTAFRLNWNKFRGKKSQSTGTSMDITLEYLGAEESSWTAQTASEQQIEIMLTLFKSGECSTQTEVAAAMGVTKGYISQLKAKAISLDLITSKDWLNLMKRANELQQISVRDDTKQDEQKELEQDF